jgi:hypothetical protein
MEGVNERIDSATIPLKFLLRIGDLARKGLKNSLIQTASLFTCEGDS